MDRFPDSLVISLFSYLSLRDRVKFESVSRRCRRILLDKCFQKLGTITLDDLVGDNPINQLRLPHAIYSLVVQKGRLIEGIVFELENTSALVAVMETLTSFQAAKLKRLEIRTIPTERYVQANDAPDFYVVNSLCKLVSLCVNLEVLKIDLSYCHELPHYMGIDLSQLIRLKLLKGNQVHFNNFDAPNLVELEYRNVRLHQSDHCVDLLRMMRAISSSIEVLILDDVSFEDDDCDYYRDDDDDSDADATNDENGIVDKPDADNSYIDVETEYKMPKLRELSLNGSLFTCTINLSESIFLNSVIVECNSCYFISIINFDLSVHCLYRFVGCGWNSVQQFVSSFVTSAITYPHRFCLLKELTIDVGCDLFNYISPDHKYLFENISVIGTAIYDPLLLANLRVLVECSPHLKTIRVDLVLDKECLIDLIISRMCIIVDVDLTLSLFSKIHGGNELAVLSDLYCALNALNTSTDERLCNINVSMARIDNIENNELRRFVGKISDNFRVFFTFQ